MSNFRWIYLIIVLFALAANDAVWARGSHGHRHSHINLGIRLGGYYNSPGFYGYGGYGGYGGYSRYGYGGYGFGGYGYGYPFYYPPTYAYPPTVVVPATPPVYIQREQPQSVQPQTNYWHYCQNPEGYYPYVKSCPGGWLRVAPQPPAQ